MRLAFVVSAALATAMCCLAGYLIVVTIHPREQYVGDALVCLALAWVWAWAIQLLLDATVWRNRVRPTR